MARVSIEPLNGDWWKDIASWLWALLLLPIGTIWKRTQNAVQKDDFTKAIDKIEATIDRHAGNALATCERVESALIRHMEDDSTTFREMRAIHSELFERAAENRTILERIDTRQHSMEKSIEDIAARSHKRRETDGSG